MNIKNGSSVPALLTEPLNAARLVDWIIENVPADRYEPQTPLRAAYRYVNWRISETIAQASTRELIAMVTDRDWPNPCECMQDLEEFLRDGDTGTLDELYNQLCEFFGIGLYHRRRHLSDDKL